MKGERRKERARQGRTGRINPKSFGMDQVQHAQNGQKKEQQRRDPRKADAIKGLRSHLGQRAKAAQRGARDEKTGDGKEKRIPIAALPEKHMENPARQERSN